MLFEREYLPYTCTGLVIVTLILYICARYAYRVNARRPDDDPQKRDFHFGAILLASVTWPLFLCASITIFFLRVLVYMVFLILFTIALLVFRKPFILVWLDKIATRVGNRLLEANTLLIRIFFGKRNENPQTP